MSVEERSPIRILIAAERTLLRVGLRRLLETDTRFVVVGEAANASETITRTRRLRPDILLLDLSMPKATGFDVLTELGKLPDLHIVVLTAAIEKRQVDEAFRRGAHGILPKGALTKSLFQSIQAVMAGHYWLENGITKRPATPQAKVQKGRGTTK